ncbi:hypothetical protein [Granulicella cerasi]|uniref:hypothetical protein n=1 Tax=Granulicella cerasi TaxID=741063 RepID=UPI0021DFD5E2|nr:hypothetical protein [Granulicella cerasi]
MPTTQDDRTAALAQLGVLLENDLFRRSSRYSALLRYIVEKALEGDYGSLKERTIGIEVFKRDIDYDTNADPVVRFCAAEIRKRLAQYYQNTPTDSIEIALPVGSYVPTFSHRLAEPDTVSAPVELSESRTTLYIPLPSEPSPAIAAPRRRWGLGALLAVAAALVATIVIYRSFGQKPDAVEAFWGPLLRDSALVKICTGTPPETSLNNAGNQSIEAAYLQGGHRVTLETASAIANVAAFLQAHREPYKISEADAETLDSFHRQPIVLINANNNQWTLLLAKPLRFHFETEGATGYIADATRPQFRGWSVDFSQPRTRQTTDYALVARFFDPTTQSPVMLLAGVGTIGTRAAGEFSVSASELRELEKQLPQGLSNTNFEAVLKTEVVHGQLGSTQIVATHTW